MLQKYSERGKYPTQYGVKAFFCVKQNNFYTGCPKSALRGVNTKLREFFLRKDSLKKYKITSGSFFFNFQRLSIHCSEQRSVPDLPVPCLWRYTNSKYSLTFSYYAFLCIRTGAHAGESILKCKLLLKYKLVIKTFISVIISS